MNLILADFNFDDFLQSIINWCQTDGIRILLAIVVLFIVFKLINIISTKIRKSMLNRHVDKTVVMVVYNILRKGVKVIVFIVFLTYIGVDTSSVGAVIASAALTVGLALQGSLSNFAGGIIILVTRPFKIDDFIETQGVKGTVEEIKMFYTYIVTGDNKVAVIPNGALTNATIINYSKKDLRRVDMQFTISYSADYDKAKELITKAMEKTGLVLDNPAPFVRMTAHLDSALEITVRMWAKASDYWNIYFQMLEDVKTLFDENNIEIPFNQLDVNLKKAD